MTTTTQTAVTTQVYRVYIKAAPQAIWDAITKPEWTERYGFGGRVEYELCAGEREAEGAGGGWSWVLSDLKTLLETGASFRGCVERVVVLRKQGLHPSTCGTVAGVELRNIRIDDLPLYEKIHCDPEMMEHLGGPLARERLAEKLQRDVASTEAGETWAGLPDEGRPTGRPCFRRRPRGGRARPRCRRARGPSPARS